MVEFGYFASLEEFSAQDCLDQAVLADETGFDTVWVNDHFLPWFDRLADGSPANGANCWSWLPAALERTSDVRMGTGVSAILNRYHPGNVAHRLGTLMELYPDRVFFGLGTGEAFNEVPLGHPWPEYNERAQRTAEAIRIIRTLFEDDYVSYEGNFWELEDAHLYSAPDTAPPIHIAGSGPTAARMAGDLGDGFVTVNKDPEAIEDDLYPSVRQGVEKSERNDSFDDLPKTVHVHVSYADTEAAALEPCKPWRTTFLPEMRNLHDPRYLQAHGEQVDTDRIRENFVIATDPDELLDVTQAYVDHGFDQVVYQSSSPDQEQFCEVIRDDVMPSFA